MKWLGLVNKEGRGKPIFLTDFGKNLLKVPERERLHILQQVMLKNDVVKHIKQHPNAPLSQALKQKNGLVGKSMYPRRKKTIQAWLNYFDNYFSGKLI